MLPQLVGPAARPGAAPITEVEEEEVDTDAEAEEGVEVEGAKKVVRDQLSENENEDECEQLSADGSASEDEHT
jgi:hypothetical protein